MSSLRGRFNPALGIRDPWDLRGFGAAVSEPAAGPRKEYVFDDSTTAVQCLSMSDSDWSYPNEPDLSEFGILVRVTLADTPTAPRWIWADYETGETLSWYLYIHNDGRLLFYIRTGVGYGFNTCQTDTSFVSTIVGVETLIYATYVDGGMKLFAGQGDDALTELDSASPVTEPFEGSGQVVFGAHTPSIWGWYGTIHQPCFFTANNGADIPTETEVGSAATPVDLGSHPALFSSPDADHDFPNIDGTHPQAWTLENSLGVQVRGS